MSNRFANIVLIGAIVVSSFLLPFRPKSVSAQSAESQTSPEAITQMVAMEAQPPIQKTMLCGAEVGDTATLSNFERVAESSAPERQHVYKVVDASKAGTIACNELTTTRNRRKKIGFTARVLGAGTSKYIITLKYQNGTIHQRLAATQVAASGWLKFSGNVIRTDEKLYATIELGLGERNVEIDDFHIGFAPEEIFLPQLFHQTNPPAPIIEASREGRFDSPNKKRQIAQELSLRESDIEVIEIVHEGRKNFYYHWLRDPMFFQQWKDGSEGDFVQLNVARSNIAAGTLTLLQPNITAEAIGSGMRIVGTVVRAGQTIATLVELSAAAAALVPIGVVVFLGWAAYNYGGPIPSAWLPVETYGGETVAYMIYWETRQFVESQQALYLYRAESIETQDLTDDIIALVSTGYDEVAGRTTGYVLTTALLADQYSPLSDNPIPFADLEIAKIVTATGEWWQTEVTNGRLQLWPPENWSAFNKPVYLASLANLTVAHYDKVIFWASRENGADIVILDEAVPGVTVDSPVTEYAALAATVSWMVNNAIAMPRELPAGSDRDEQTAWLLLTMAALLEYVRDGVDVGINLPRRDQKEGPGNCLNRVPVTLWTNMILADSLLYSSEDFFRAIMNALSTGEVTYNKAQGERKANSFTFAKLEIKLPAPVAVDPEALGGNSEDITERDHAVFSTECIESRHGGGARWSEFGGISFIEEFSPEGPGPLEFCYDRPRAGVPCGL